MWHTMSIEETRRELKTNIESGLSDNEASKRLKSYGYNKLAEKKKESIIIRFIKEFNDFMIIILILAAVVSAVMAYFDGSNDYVEPIIIIAIVIFNALMGLIQESKAEKSLEALKKMSAPTAKVKRGGRVFIIASEEVIPGDIIILEAGNFVAADCRLIKAYNLHVEESALTGETVPVLKDTTTKTNKALPIGDISNMAFSTTIVTGGHAEAIVTDTAMNTKVGKIAKMIISDVAPETPLQKKLAGVGKALGTVALIICFAIFIIGVIKNISIEEMFMTSIGLAVAAIPEGLPAIVTIMLSIGVTKMAKKNAIIRKLPAVETLGSSSVICSDKTGTLTQNKMEVVKVVDYMGVAKSEINNYILRLGSMCNDSNVYAEGAKIIVEGEPTENAIVNAGIRCGENKEELYKTMPRINEIPFDSNRKLMSTVHKVGNKYRVITKGAPDVLLNKCSRYYQNGTVSIMSTQVSNKITATNTDMANQALRVLAVAYNDFDYMPSKIDSNTLENNLIFTRTYWYD